MIKLLCKECGGRHWSHEPHVNQPKRSPKEIMYAAKPDPSAPELLAEAPPEPVQMGSADAAGEAEILPTALRDAAPTPAAEGPPLPAADPDQGDQVARHQTDEDVKREKRNAYMRAYARRRRESAK